MSAVFSSPFSSFDAGLDDSGLSHDPQIAKLRVPLAVEVGVGANWDQAH